MTIDDHPANSQIIQQIHNDFRASQKIIISTLEDELTELSKTEELEKRIKKAEKMRSFGFILAKGSDTKQSELDKLKEIYNEKQKLLDVIIGYTVKYPTYKFISEEEVERLCIKYNLLFGSVFRFTDEIPDSNFDEILKFKELIDEDDIPVGKIIDEDDLQNLSKRDLFRKYIDLESNRHESTSYYHSYSRYSSGPEPLMICAPAKHMNMDGVRISNEYKMETSVPVYYPDPVVLQPVHEGYLIVTAWGSEASDPIVINPIKN